MKLLTTVIISTLSLSAMAYESYIIQSYDEPSIVSLDISQEIFDENNEIQRQFKANGYYHTYSENAVSLIAFKDNKAVLRLNHDSDPYFKQLRMSPSEFQLSFPFDGMTSVDAEHVLGYAPSGSAEGTGIENAIWNGITAYFNDDNLGTCRLVVFDMPSLQGQSIYDKSNTTFEINDKPTTKSAEGNPESGFIYETSWTGKRYEKQLECANNKPFDKQLLQDLVAYAKKIDNDLPDTP